MIRPLLFAAFTAALAAPAFAQTAPATSPRDYQEDYYVTPYWTRQPVIEALGRAEMEVAPNRSSFSAVYVETDKDPNAAAKLAVERARLAYDTIKKAGGDKTRVTTSVSVAPYFEQYRDDGSIVENTRADKVKGYEARASVSVIIEGETALAGRARAAALALGPQESSGLMTYLQATTEMNRQAYEAAVADGAARARATAQAAGQTLGRLLAVQEGNGPCLGRWTTNAGRLPLTGGQEFYASPAPEPAYAERALETVTVTSSRIGGRDVAITEADLSNLDLPSDDVKQVINAGVCMIYAVGN